MKKFIYIIFILSCVLLFSELSARFYLKYIIEKSPKKKYRFSYYRVYEHMPNWEENDKNGFVRMKFNMNGFRRDQDVSKTKPDNTYRAFLLGGSAAHGYSRQKMNGYPIRHIYQNETIDAFLEKKLKIQFPHHNVEIINAAVAGYHVFQHTQYILSELIDYKPDLIIFFDGINDHFINNPNYNSYLNYKYQFWKSRLQDPSLLGLFDYFIFYMANYSALFRSYHSFKLQKDVIKFIDESASFISDNNELNNHNIASKRQLLRNIDLNYYILKMEGIDIISCLQPMLKLRNDEMLTQEELDLKFGPPENIELYPIIADELDSLASKYTIDFIDFNPIFNDQQYKENQLFLDYCHLTPIGGEVVADKLFPLVEKKIRNHLFESK